jgi:hypothetical protein
LRGGAVYCRNPGLLVTSLCERNDKKLPDDVDNRAASVNGSVTLPSLPICRPPVPIWNEGTGERCDGPKHLPAAVVIRIDRILPEQPIPTAVLKTFLAFPRSAARAWRRGAPPAGILRFHWFIPPTITSQTGFGCDFRWLLHRGSCVWFDHGSTNQYESR